MTTGAGTNRTVSTASSLLKKTYADRVEDLVPESDKLSKMLPFIAAEKQPGGGYIQPVTLGTEVGFTFYSGGGLQQLNKPIAAAETYAEITGYEMVGRTAMSYGLLQRALKGAKSGGMRAFVQTMHDSVEKLVKGASYAREVQLLYGGGASVTSNLGVIESVTGSSGTSLVATITAKSWATGIWAGREGLECDIYEGSSKQNTNGTAGQADSIYKLASVDIANRKLTFTSHADNVTAVDADDVIFFAGARANEMLGLSGVCATSGSLWGISNSTYSLWKPQRVQVNGQLTFEKFIAGLTPVADLGFVGEMQGLVSPTTWQDLMEDQAAIVQHAKAAGGTVEMGFEKIKFYGQTGSVTIEPHIYMKRGEAYAIPKGEGKRIGSTDITMGMPGHPDKMIRELEDYAGVEARCYYDQAPFWKRPAFLVQFYDIVNAH